MIIFSNRLFPKSILGFEKWTFLQVYKMSKMRNLKRVLKKPFLSLQKSDLDHNALNLRKMLEKYVMRKIIIFCRKGFRD